MASRECTDSSRRSASTNPGHGDTICARERLPPKVSVTPSADDRAQMTSPPFDPSTRESSARRGRLDLSIVVPAFNEEQRLPKTLQSIRAYLKSRSLQAEVLVVDDGSTDATAKVVELSRTGFPELRLIPNGRNHGKGF